jgi:phage-related protein
MIEDEEKRDGAVTKFQVIFFEKENGEIPAEEFMDALERKMNAKMARAISALQEHGNELREPYSKYLDDGIFELRAKAGSDISRVLYFFYVGKKVILTHGFIKKTKKTPASEIDKAKSYRKEYLDRKENEI